VKQLLAVSENFIDNRIFRFSGGYCKGIFRRQLRIFMNFKNISGIVGISKKKSVVSVVSFVFFLFF
jgi:hypothetical protein